MSAAEPSSSKRETVRFGLFEADLAAGELRKRGRTVKLQGQPFQILAMLLRRPGEVVSRGELQQALWPSGTFVEFEHGVNTAIRKIREALGDSADNPRFIETLPRKGYRFIAPVDAGPPVAAPRRSTTPWLAAAAVIVAACVWLLVARWKTPAPTPIVNPLTTYPGSEWSPSFSPDGGQVAFYWDGGGKPNAEGLYVKVIGTDAPVRLAAGDTGSPAWSPDGRWIAFSRLSGEAWPPDRGTVAVLLIPATGGPERKLVEIRSPKAFFQWGRLAWHPDGEWLAFADHASPGEPDAIHLVSVVSGEKRRLTSPPNGSFDVWPAFSPEGRSLVFVRAAAETSSDLYVLEVTRDLTPSGEARRLTFRNTWTQDPVWTRDGKAILFVGGSYHNPALWVLDLGWPDWRPRVPERLAFAGFGARHLVVSRQGQLAYAVFNFDADIWRLDLRGKQSITKLIASSRLDHTPQYSPDGRRIAFGSDRSGSHEIWVCNSDGSNPVQLTSLGGPYVAAPRWAPDGRRIAFQLAGKGGYSVYVISANGGRPQRLVAGGPSGWSRDGKWIYFSSELSGVHEAWKVSASGGQAVQVTHNGGDFATESLDGRFLYYMKTKQGTTSLWRMPLESGTEVQVLDFLSPYEFFVVAEQGVYFLPEPKRVQFYSFATRKVETVAELPKGTMWGFSVSPDGRSLLCTLGEDHPSDLMLVENFR